MFSNGPSIADLSMPIYQGIEFKKSTSQLVEYHADIDSDLHQGIRGAKGTLPEGDA